MIPSDWRKTDEVSPEKLIPVIITWYYRLVVSNATDKLSTYGTS
jgi:hypothetical protein